MKTSMECQAGVVCNPSAMSISFPKTLFGDSFIFEDEGECAPQLNGDLYTSAKPLGQCSSIARETSSDGQRITFKRQINAIVSAETKGKRVIASDGSVAEIFGAGSVTKYSVDFTCAFPASFEMSAARFAISTQPINLTAAASVYQSGGWEDSFELQFFGDATFSKPLDASSCPVSYPYAFSSGEQCCTTQSQNCSEGRTFQCPNAPCSNFDPETRGMLVGKEVFVQSSWKVEGLEDSVRYFVDYCTIEDTASGISIPIVKDSCYAGLVGAEPLGAVAEPGAQSKVVPKTSTFKFTFFTFDLKSKANVQDLTCTLRLCLWDGQTSDCSVASRDGSGVCPADEGYNYMP